MNAHPASLARKTSENSMPAAFTPSVVRGPANPFADFDACMGAVLCFDCRMIPSLATVIMAGDHFFTRFVSQGTDFDSAGYLKTRRSSFRCRQMSALGSS
jgi:hypothetical protein